MNGRDIRICTIFAFAKMEFMEKLHPIMFAGTGSDVGKSIIAAAFCRIFKQDAISRTVQGTKYGAQFICHSRRAGDRPCPAVQAEAPECLATRT